MGDARTPVHVLGRPAEAPDLIDMKTVEPTLRQHGVRPEDSIAMFATGSLVRGWANETSDLDVHVITEGLYESTQPERVHVALDPDTLRHQRIYADGRRWDIEYWSQSQVDQLLHKVSWESYADPEVPWATVSADEIAMLERLPYAVAAEGGDWLDDVQRRLAESAHSRILVGMSLRQAGGYVEDAAGQLQSGDLHSAVLAARLAFGHTVDAVQASLGQFGSNWPKWRSRRMKLVNSPDLSFEQYWEIETMETFRRDDPVSWITSTLELSRRLSSRLEI